MIGVNHGTTIIDLREEGEEGTCSEIAGT